MQPPRELRRGLGGLVSGSVLPGQSGSSDVGVLGGGLSSSGAQLAPGGQLLTAEVAG